jgi:hypothetical protein
MTPRQLRRKVRREEEAPLARRRWAVGLSLLGAGLALLALGTLLPRAPGRAAAPRARAPRTGEHIGKRHGWHLGPLTIPRPWPHWHRGAARA